jgi:peroxiredoxin
MPRRNYMKRGVTVGVAALVILVGLTAGMAPQDKPYLPAGEEAPLFNGEADDGEEYSMQAMLKEGPVFVLFWKESCPHNRRAAPTFNALNDAYGDKVNFVGFVKTSLEGARGWAEQFGTNYPLLADSDGEAIKDYKVTYSICTFEIGTDGKIANVYEGYGAESMKSLNAAMAKAAGSDVADVDLSGSPARMTWG